MSLRLGSLLLALTLLAVPVRTASAHPKLVSATPAANSKVNAAPQSLSATFNESITPALSKLSLVDANQRVIALEDVKLADGDNKTLTARVPVTLAPGRYTVKWQAAGGDGHPMKGEFTFLVAP